MDLSVTERTHGVDPIMQGRCQECVIVTELLIYILLLSSVGTSKEMAGLMGISGSQQEIIISQIYNFCTCVGYECCV